MRRRQKRTAGSVSTEGLANKGTDDVNCCCQANREERWCYRDGRQPDTLVREDGEAGTRRERAAAINREDEYGERQAERS